MDLGPIWSVKWSGTMHSNETLLLTLDALLDVRCGYALRDIGGVQG